MKLGTLFSGLIILLQFGCGRGNWIIRTDPMLENYTNAMLTAWKAQNPGATTPEIFVQSTEFMLKGQQLGRPADILFGVDAGYPEFADANGLFEARTALGGDHLVWVEVVGKMIDQEGDSCLALSPSDSPVRRMTDEWKPGLGQNAKGCVTYPQSVRLVNEYAELAKVRWAILAGKDVKALGADVRILAEGPEWEGLYRIAIPKGKEIHPDARAFYSFCEQEKSKISVGDFPTNP